MKASESNRETEYEGEKRIKERKSEGNNEKERHLWCTLTPQNCV